MEMYTRYKLMRRIVESRQVFTRLTIQFTDDAIFPYEERSSSDTGRATIADLTVAAKIDAYAIFEMCTANIINEQKLFVR